MIKNLIQYSQQFYSDLIHGKEAKQRISEIKSNINGISELRRDEMNSKIEESNKLKTKLKPFKMEGIKLNSTKDILTSNKSKSHKKFKVNFRVKK